MKIVDEMFRCVTKGEIISIHSQVEKVDAPSGGTEKCNLNVFELVYYMSEDRREREST